MSDDQKKAGALGDQYVLGTYQKLSGMIADLVPNIWAFNLPAKVVTCHNHIQQCDMLVLHLKRSEHKIENEIREATLDFELKMQDLLRKDPEVCSYPTKEGKNVAARHKLNSNLRDIDILQGCAQEISQTRGVVWDMKQELTLAICFMLFGIVAQPLVVCFLVYQIFSIWFV